MKELIERYGTSGMVAIGGREFPVINIPMMSDEKWQRLAREHAVHSFIVCNGREPASVEEAVMWQRAAIAEWEREAAYI